MPSRTVGQIEKFLGGGHIGGDRDIALFGHGDLEESASERVGVASRTSAEGDLRLGRHRGVGGVKVWARVVVRVDGRGKKIQSLESKMSSV